MVGLGQGCDPLRGGREQDPVPGLAGPDRQSLLTWEVAAGLDRAAVAGVQTLDRVGAADDPPDLDVIVQERDELGPGAVSEPDHRRVARPPFLSELVEAERAAVAWTAV